MPQFPVQTCNNQNGVLKTVVKCNSTKHRFTYPEPHAKHKMVTRLPPPSLGSYSLSNDNSDCFENVTLKVNLRCLNLIALIPSRSIRQTLATTLNSKGLYQSSGKENESCCLVFPSSTKREISHFHVVLVQRRLRNEQKSVIHFQSCCFACLNLFLFFPLSLPSPSLSPSSLLKLPNDQQITLPATCAKAF